MRPTTIQINVIVFGEPESGLWCDDCALPSAIRVRLVGQHGMSVMEMGTFVSCIECESAQAFHDRAVRGMRTTVWVPKSKFVDISDYTNGDWTEIPYDDELP